MKFFQLFTFFIIFFFQKMWLQKENIDIPFNYLIGGDGRAYEVRGWSIQSNSDIRRNTSLSIGLIGEYFSISQLQQCQKKKKKLIK